MIINKYINGGGGSGSGSTGPQGPQGPQGGVGPQGPQGQDGIEQAPTVLKSVNELPSDAEEGDVVALYAEGEGLPNGILFEERNDLGENEDMSGGRFQFPIDGFADVTQENPLQFGSMTAPDNTNYDMYVYQDEWGLSFVLSTDGDMYDPNFALTMSVGSDNAGYNMYSDMVVSYHYTESTDEYYVVDIFPETTGNVSFDIPQAETEIGVFQYDGNDWNAVGGGAGGSQDFIHLDNLGTSGETGKTYEYNGRLMVWVEGSGYTAEWLNPIDQIRQSGNEGTGFIYAAIPDGQVLFEFRNNNSGDYRKVVYSGNTLYLTETAGTVVCAVTVGNTFKFEAQTSGNIRNIEGIFQNGYIGFRIGTYGSLQMQNVWNGSVNGSHYELIDKYNYPYTLAGNGIPQWNDKGQVTKLNQSISTKDYYFNATGTATSNKTTVLTTGRNNGPDHLFGPTDGGTQGQILLSNGNAAPVWSDWIKAVKITSNAYEALAVKDPNVLYLIDDE